MTMAHDLLARLEAESGVRRLVALYCDAVNRRDADAAGALFAPDARIAIADFPPIAGADAIREGMRQTFAAHEFLRQHCDVGLIDVAGERAAARLSVFEASKRPGEAEVSLIFGFYEDAYVRLGGTWRFWQRRYVLQFRSRHTAARFQLAPAADLALIFDS
jgi:ketosteroid isomerase-like protein